MSAKLSIFYGVIVDASETNTAIQLNSKSIEIVNLPYYGDVLQSNKDYYQMVGIRLDRRHPADVISMQSIKEYSSKCEVDSDVHRLYMAGVESLSKQAKLRKFLLESIPQIHIFIEE